MAFTYSASSSTDRNKLRLLISDTSSSSYLFDDDELDLFLEIYGNVHYSAGAACRAIAANKALQAIAFTLHDRDLHIDKRDIPKHYLKLAEMFESAEANISVIEYFDSIEDEIDRFGIDRGEYIGDENLT